MERRVELNKDISDIKSEGSDPKITFSEDGKKLLIEVAINSEEVPDPEDAETPKDQYVDLFDENGNLYISGLVVRIIKSTDETSVLQLTAIVHSYKIPNGA